MACYHPLTGWKAITVNPSGKRSIVFNPAHGFHDMPVVVPCGQCVGCRLEYSRQWALRCMNEASLHEENCMITLTYKDKCLPEYGTLVKKDFQDFMKRLRKAISDGRVVCAAGKLRYFHCGEYGDKEGRPHYHALLFGFDFADKKEWSRRNGYPVWRSAVLEELWKYGQSEIGSVTFESAAYVARYVVKKMGDGIPFEDQYLFCDEDGVVRYLQKEYTTMSRRPGIGKEWFDRFHEEVYREDGVVMRGVLSKPPRYYDGKYELIDPDGAAAVCRKRVRCRNRGEETPERLAVREKVAEARLSLSRRIVE